MWSRFDPTTIDRDFARIRGLGANTVRIFIQPSVFGFPTVRPVMADHLSEVIGLAAKHSLRVHLTLFDWWSTYTDINGSKEWVSSLLSRYRDDPRIVVVELQNEVDPRNRQAVAWVSTMLPYLSTVMPGTLRTVSVASVPPEVFALFTRELKNSPPDFWDYHYYGPPGDALSVLNGIKAFAAPRPLFVGETGYSTDETPGDQAAQEQAQAAYYRAVFAAAAALELPTPAPWILNDFSPGGIPPQSPAADDAGPVRLWFVPAKRYSEASGCRRSQGVLRKIIRASSRPRLTRPRWGSYSWLPRAASGWGTASTSWSLGNDLYGF